MSNTNGTAIKPGARVRIRIATGLGVGMTGRVTELRDPLGPNGALVYRVKLRGKPLPAYVELMEDQMEVVPPAVDEK